MFKVDKEKCVGCRTCINVCPAGAISMKDDKAMIGNKCVDCGRCVQVCPADAIYPGMQSRQDISLNQGQMFSEGAFGAGRGSARGMSKGLGRGPRDGRGRGRGGGRGGGGRKW